MKDFVIYSYQFVPLIDDRELNLFEDVQGRRRMLMDNKNAIFDSLIENIDFSYRNRVYQKEIAIHEKNLIILRIANRKCVKLEKAFHVVKEDDEPSSIVIIDNRDKIQRVAIEQNMHSFANTDIIKNILLQNFRKALKDKELDFTMGKEYLPKEFWDICNRYKGKVTKVVFSYKYPNLGRAHEELKKMLEDSSANTNSQETQIIYGNQNGLILSEEDEVVAGCVKDSSEGGEPISMKIKGLSKTVRTGKTEKVIKIDEVDIVNGNIDNLKALLKDI